MSGYLVSPPHPAPAPGPGPTVAATPCPGVPPPSRQESVQERNASVDEMVKRLQNYFQKTNTKYLLADNTGVELFVPNESGSLKKEFYPNVNATEFIPRSSKDQQIPLVPAGFILQMPSPPPPPPAPVQNPPPAPMQNPPPSFANEKMPIPFLFGQPMSPKPIAVPSSIAAPAPVPVSQQSTIMINEPVNNIDDLLAICDKYPYDATKKYNINLKAIHDIRDPLKEMQQMVGMKSLKQNIVDQIIYFIQNLHLRKRSMEGSHPFTVEKVYQPQNQENGGVGAMAAATNVQEPQPHPQPQPQFVGEKFMFNFSDKPIKVDVASLFNFQPGGQNPFSKMFENSGGDGNNNVKKNSGDFMHTVIYGPPGTGKTEVARIMGRIFSNLGVLKRKTFKKVTRHDLIAGYLGQTALKTKDAIRESLGGVLFIDEAYSLGNTEKRDSFSKECIDTLCEALSDHKDNWMVIIAGYEKELNDCFFNYNEGLNSRFVWRFKLDAYEPHELKAIFEKKVNENDWSVVDELPVSWFEKHKNYFTFFGRDMETLFAKTKIAHSRRVFCLPEACKTKITMEDLEKGFEMYIQNDEVKERKERAGETKMMMSNIYL